MNDQQEMEQLVVKPCQAVVGRYVGDCGERLRGGVCFFFSSRRRHTRLQGDWSSDVCSSDLLPTGRYRAVLAGYTLDFIHLPGDANGDGKVDIIDFQTIETHYGLTNASWSRSEERRVGKEGRSRGSPYH